MGGRVVAEDAFASLQEVGRANESKAIRPWPGRGFFTPEEKLLTLHASDTMVRDPSKGVCALQAVFYKG
ncbi:MAG: hypothetical protein ABUK11_07950 [Mariprofundaceae bacterium]